MGLPDDLVGVGAPGNPTPMTKPLALSVSSASLSSAKRSTARDAGGGGDGDGDDDFTDKTGGALGGSSSCRDRLSTLGLNDLPSLNEVASPELKQGSDFVSGNNWRVNPHDSQRVTLLFD